MVLVFQKYVDRGKSTPIALLAHFLRVLPSYKEESTGKVESERDFLGYLHF